ncbi:hypothetical protein C1Y40_01751 [Mycobacterium talmoniae]|uniref:Uncharacterized protein n=1 Tax=Mycobacterium talmoniae TaxID=1858794 RepID=A0A2S8BMR9_9MYCO|nr:hypothetical protein C1Y40_01751 [Mycobacterium talmoniae]
MGLTDPCVLPIRSAITVAGIDGYARNNSRLLLDGVDFRHASWPLNFGGPASCQRSPHRIAAHPQRSP